MGSWAGLPCYLPALDSAAVQALACKAAEQVYASVS
jgi:hypothetical protein